MYSINGRVGTSQTGADGRMKLAAALDMMQDCSIFWMESEGDFSRYLTEHGLALLLASRQADIFRLPVYGERISVSTGIYQCKGYSGYRNTVLFGEDGAPCIQSWSMGAFVHRERGELVKLPPSVDGQLAVDPKVDMTYLPRRISLPDVPFRQLPGIPVRRNDIDFNAHVNNVRYLEAALELLPETRAIGRFRVEYKTSARLGDTLYPSLAEADEKSYVLLNDENGKAYSIMEFSGSPHTSS